MRDETDLSELIARIALRDRAAFDALYAQTRSKLFGVALKMMKSRADAEDLLQEAYVRIWHRADRFNTASGSATGWLVTLTRNLAIDHLRARKPAPDPVDAATELPDSRPTPEAHAENTSERARIDICLEKLEALKAAAVREAYMRWLPA
ncbi:MAG: sigma-70 family RNA polymerase sigma factor, partial [Pseudomonadota bacterium]